MTAYESYLGNCQLLSIACAAAFFALAFGMLLERSGALAKARGRARADAINEAVAMIQKHASTMETGTIAEGSDLNGYMKLKASHYRQAAQRVTALHQEATNG
jgi:hypothetical protein